MRARGFTLVELVVVIVLLGIVLVSATIFFTGTVGGYIDTARRGDSATAARVALDRMGRELREAMPMSVRVFNSSKCIQFLPIATSSIYTSFPIATTTISVLDFPQTIVSPLYAAIYPINEGDLYSMIAMASVSGISNPPVNSLRTITLGSTYTYPRQSPVERIYFVGRPVSFCFNGTSLVRFTSDVAASVPAIPAVSPVLLDSVNNANSSFAYSPGNLRANGLITINVAISRAVSSGAAETLRLDHEVWVHNAQ